MVQIVLDPSKPEGNSDYNSLNERERQFQGSIWALKFLLAELAMGLLVLRKKLIQKGVLSTKEDDELAETILNPENLQKMYENVELAFGEKYQKARYAAEHPEEVIRQVEQMKQAPRV